MKKLLSLLLCVVIVLSVAVIPTSAKMPLDKEKFFHEHLLAFEEEIDVSGLGYKADDIMDIVYALNDLYYKYADLFYYGGLTSYSLLDDDITSVYVQYTYTYQQVEFVRTYAEEHYLSKVNPTWSQLEKVLFIHDQLAVDYQYDIRLYDPENYMYATRDIYGMFTEKQGVCQAYSNTFMYLMQELGIECKLVASDASNHEWNVVKVDGEWYHVDVTQDDPIYTISEDGISDIAGLIEHKYFLESDRSINEALTEGDHYDWYYLDNEPVTCTSDKYTKGYIFEDALTAFVPIGNKWYYLEKDGSEIEFEYTQDFMEDEVIFEIPAEWAAEIENAYWPGGYTGLYNTGNWLLYNTDSTVSGINVVTKEKMVLYTLDEIKAIDTTIPENYHIFGSKLKDGKIYCQIAIGPVADKYYTISLDLCEEEHRTVGDWVIIQNATHETEGIQVKICQFCGEEVEREILPKREHRLVRESSLDVAATCTVTGKKAYKCMNTGCDYVELRDDGKLADHIWVEDTENNVEATCTTDGKIVYKCEYGCGETQETVVGKIEHSFIEDAENSVDATCTADGKIVYKCEYGCGETTETVVGKIEHSFIEDAENSVDATCTADGKVVYKCEYGCGETTETVVEKLGHRWVKDEENSIAPTKENEGLKVEKCANNCGETKETVIPALGDVIPGDVNGDNSVNAGDLAVLKKGIAGSEEIVVAFFDCDGNGIVNAGDLAVLKKFIAGLISAIR